MWRRENPCILLVCIAPMENNMEVPQKKKLRIELLYDPAIPLLGIYPKKTKTLTLTQEDMCTLVFIAALFTIAKMWKQPVFTNK